MEGICKKPLLYPFEANLTSKRPDVSVARIVGGTIVPIEEVPYMASLLDGDEFICGGGILSDLYVLSAAHCIYL